MNIAVLSGKGGTGKTTISVNLFSFLHHAVLIDTDTEEPNTHLFLHGTKVEESSVTKQYPVVHMDTCTLCGACGNVCNFNAIIPAKQKVLVFEDLCHDCGFCQLVCDDGAITYAPKQIGTIEHYVTDDNKRYFTGTLEVGEVSGVKIIEELRNLTNFEQCVIIDAPPGVSCSTVSAIRNVDYAIIVAEPTPFGLSDMKMVVELLEEEQTPYGVVINKAGIGNRDMYQYLHDNQIPLLTEIPFTKERAKHYSKGDILLHVDRLYQHYIESIIESIRRELT